MARGRIDRWIGTEADARDVRLTGGPLYDLTTPAERRLRGALSFSGIVTPAVIILSVLLRRPVTNPDKAMVLGWFSLALSLASVLATWTLLAALVDRRPVWTDRLARRAWVWAAFSCLTLGVLGWVGRGSATLGAALLYGVGMSAVGAGLIGLTISALPHRGRSGT